MQDDAKLYKSSEISNLIVGLGLGLKGEELGQLRYGKVRLWGELEGGLEGGLKAQMETGQGVNSAHPHSPHRLCRRGAAASDPPAQHVASAPVFFCSFVPCGSACALTRLCLHALHRSSS